MAMLRMCKRADVALLGPASFHCGCMEGLFWGDVAAKMESSLLVTAYLAHGACSCLSAYATGLAAERFGRRVVHASLTAVGVVACALAAVALHEGDGPGSGSGCSVCRDKALVASTALFGCYDLAAQGLVRAALGQRFNGSVDSDCMEPAMAHALFSLTTGSVLLFGIGAAGSVTPWVIAVALIPVGLLSSLCLSRSTCTAAQQTAAA